MKMKETNNYINIAALMSTNIDVYAYIMLKGTLGV